MKIVIKLAFRLTAYGLTIAAGFGAVSSYWLIGALFAAYLLSIYDESANAPDGDFRALQTTDFMASDTNIKKKLGVRVVYLAIVYAVCWGFSLTLSAL